MLDFFSFFFALYWEERGRKKEGQIRRNARRLSGCLLPVLTPRGPQSERERKKREEKKAEQRGENKRGRTRERERKEKELTPHLSFFLSMFFLSESLSFFFWVWGSFLFWSFTLFFLLLVLLYLAICQSEAKGRRQLLLLLSSPPRSTGMQ